MLQNSKTQSCFIICPCNENIQNVTKMVQNVMFSNDIDKHKCYKKCVRGEMSRNVLFEKITHLVNIYYKSKKYSHTIYVFKKIYTKKQRCKYKSNF